MTFKEHCEEKLSHRNFKKLHENLGTTKYTLTTWLNNPTKMPMEAVINFGKTLGYLPLELIDEWQLGIDKITIREYNNLKK